jgi:hypothetical protein
LTGHAFSLTFLPVITRLFVYARHTADCSSRDDRFWRLDNPAGQDITRAATGTLGDAQGLRFLDELTALDPVKILGYVD